jgi:HPt (histidine-containing phosphotransfer) domain-containing protein
MSETHDAIRDQFETLHESYLAELPRRILRAREIWDRMSDDGWDSVAWHDLHRLIHGLAGSGAIYGFPMISAAARALDVQLRAIVQDTRAPGKSQKQELAALLDLIALAAHVAQHGGASLDLVDSSRAITPET